METVSHFKSNVNNSAFSSRKTIRTNGCGASDNCPDCQVIGSENPDVVTGAQSANEKPLMTLLSSDLNSAVICPWILAFTVSREPLVGAGRVMIMPDSLDRGRI